MLRSIVSKKSLISLFHSYSEKNFERLGFKWEVRRRGELKIGLVRKKLTKNKNPIKMRRLVFIPGFGDTPISWMGIFIPMIPFLKKHYDEIVWIDFPGFAGFLAHEKAFHSMSRLKESLFDALDTLEPVTLIGHSLGGWLATSYAAQKGSEVQKLVLVCPGGVALGEENQDYWKALFRSAKDQGFESFRKHVFHKEPFWFSFIKEGFTKFFSNEEILLFMDSILEKDFLHQELEHIKAEVFFIWGEKDTLIPYEWVSDWTNKLKVNSTVFKVIDSGHSPQIETPLQVIYILSKILSDQKTVSRVISFAGFKKGFEVESIKALSVSG